MLSRLTTWPRFLDSLAYRKASFDGDLRIIRHPYKQPKKEGARQGLSISAIAARLYMDRKTIRKYIEDGVQAPRCGPRAPRPCVVDPFVSYVTEGIPAGLRAGNGRMRRCPYCAALAEMLTRV
jgi:hypothetical protein